MFFEQSYFQGEERDGFYIKPMMKRVWAAQMEVLHQLDIICKRHKIPYQADWGTLLGAVRHKGYLPLDKTDEDIQLQILHAVFVLKEFLVKDYNKGKLTKEEQLIYIKKIEELCNIHFDFEKPMDEQIFLLIDNICAMYWDTDANEVCYFLDFFIKPHLRFPKDWFSSFIEMPFENMMLPVPAKYHEILTILCGDYMIPIQGSASHEYPSYRRQQEILFHEFQRKGIEIPEIFKE